MTDLMNFSIRLLTASCLFLAFSSCSEKSLKTESKVKIAGNGGGYNGGGDKAYLIPALPSLTETSHMHKQMLDAHVKCTSASFDRGNEYDLMNVMFEAMNGRKFAMSCIQSGIWKLSEEERKLPKWQKHINSCNEAIQDRRVHSRQQISMVIASRKTIVESFNEAILSYLENEDMAKKFYYPVDEQDDQMYFLGILLVSGTLNDPKFTPLISLSPMPNMFSTLVSSPRADLTQVELPPGYDCEIPFVDLISGTPSGLTWNGSDFKNCFQSSLFEQSVTTEKRIEELPSLTEADWKSTIEQQYSACATYKPWTQALLNSKSGGKYSFHEIADSIEFEYSQRKRLTQRLFNQFIQGDFNFSKVQKCAKPTRRYKLFLATLDNTFYEESVDHLLSKTDSRFEQFIKDSGYFNRVDRWNLFSITGGEREAPHGIHAGFHRLRRSIHMDSFNISPKEWFGIFVHEIAHRNDDRLARAENYFLKNTGTKDYLMKLSTTATELSQLSADDRAKLTSIISFALDRGLWAEYRAWQFTLDTGKTTQGEFLKSDSPWLNSIKNAKDPKCALYQHLRANAIQPVAEEWTSPLLQKAIQTELDKITCENLSLLGEIE